MRPASWKRLANKPQAWLADVLARIAELPQSRLPEFLPLELEDGPPDRSSRLIHGTPRMLTPVALDSCLEGSVGRLTPGGRQQSRGRHSAAGGRPGSIGTPPMTPTAWDLVGVSVTLAGMAIIVWGGWQP